nr:TetR-like C-terminal domain-containing protein [Microvirga sp. HBU67558]
MEVVAPRFSFSATASAADDLRALLHSVASVMNGEAGRIIASILAEAQGDPNTHQALLDHYSNPLRRASIKLLQAGIDSGEFRADLELEPVLDAAFGALYLHLLLGWRLDRVWVDQVADTLLNGCRQKPPLQPFASTNNR